MKRAIGIDINKKHVSLVQLCKKGSRYFLEKTYTKECHQKEADAGEIQALISKAIESEGFDTKAPAIISMPYGKVFFHNYKTGIALDKDITQLLKFDLEDDFPISFDDLLIDICSKRNFNEHTKEFFVGAVSWSKLHGWVRAIRKSGLHCTIATSDACVFSSLAKLNKKSHSDNCSIVIHSDDCRIIIAVYQHGSLIFARHIDNIETSKIVSVVKREIEFTLREISDSDISETSQILLTGSSKLVSVLSEKLSKETSFKIVTLDPFSGIEIATEHKTDDRLTIALGLALLGLDSRTKALNFIAAEKAGTEHVVKTKRNAVIFASLLFSLAALFLINLFVRLNALENEKQFLEEQIRGIFVQTFPDEKKIVDELAQTKEKYDSLDQEYKTIASEIFDRTPALDILEDISENIAPDQNISVSDITMTADSVQLSATAADFESVDKLVEKFKKIPEFDSINPGNIDIDSANNRVRFNLIMKVGAN